MITVGLVGLFTGGFRWDRHQVNQDIAANQLALAEAVRECTLPGDIIHGEASGVACFFSERRWSTGRLIGGNPTGIDPNERPRGEVLNGEGGELRRELVRMGVTHIVTTDAREAALGRVLYAQTLSGPEGGLVFLVKLVPGPQDKNGSPDDMNPREIPPIVRQARRVKQINA
jgi:hypothetical protein